jgi:hypothetical protein
MHSGWVVRPGSPPIPILVPAFDSQTMGSLASSQQPAASSQQLAASFSPCHHGTEMRDSLKSLSEIDFHQQRINNLQILESP